MCVLPSQATEVFKEIRAVAEERFQECAKDKTKSRPLFISCLAATGFPKLKLMLSPDTNFLRTPIAVNTIREYLSHTENAVPENPSHPAKEMAMQQTKMHKDVILSSDGQGTLGPQEG